MIACISNKKMYDDKIVTEWKLNLLCLVLHRQLRRLIIFFVCVCVLFVVRTWEYTEHSRNHLCISRCHRELNDTWYNCYSTWIMIDTIYQDKYSHVSAEKCQDIQQGLNTPIWSTKIWSHLLVVYETVTGTCRLVSYNLFGYKMWCYVVVK